MLHRCNSGTSPCDGLTQREFLRIGALGLTGLTIPEWTLARAEGSNRKARPRARNCIILYSPGTLLIKPFNEAAT